MRVYDDGYGAGIDERNLHICPKHSLARFAAEDACQFVAI